VFHRVASTFAIMALASTSALAGTPTRVPAKITQQIKDRFAQQSKFQRLNHLSAETRGLVASVQHESSGRLRSIPTWHGSFSFAGASWPYVMAGRAPQRGDTTEIDTSLIVVSFKFDEFADANGNPLVIGSQDIVDDVVGSPNFVRSEYSVGRAQFGDAIQRASFFNVMERDWHTTLERPRMLKPVTIEVPVGQAQVFDVGGGTFVGIVNFDFLYSQIQTILQLEDVRTDELPILISHNVFADAALGFHDAVDVQVGNRKGIQTYTWTSWLDLSAFGATFADATTMTHEVSEWISDPFTNNNTPAWLIPQSGGACNSILEVGDPIEFLANQEYTITLHGHDYHTQNETLISWFSHETSTTFQHAYSYPDTTVLTAPFDVCPTAP
jgi:hypothetical protein